MSTFDALAEFTQLEMSEEDREKTAFCTHRGLWQFKRMPFGLQNGPSVFQRVTQTVLAPYLWLFTLVYIDNIVVYSVTFKDHVEVLVAVRGGDLVSLFEIFQISVPVPVTMWRVPFVKSSRHTQGSRYRIASLLMRLNYLATAEGSRTNRLCNCAKFPTQQLKHSCGERSSEVTIR